MNAALSRPETEPGGPGTMNRGKNLMDDPGNRRFRVVRYKAQAAIIQAPTPH